MKTYQLKETIHLPIPIDEAWDFFSNPNNLSKIMPSSMGFKVIKGATLPLNSGQIIEYQVTPLPFYKTGWISEIKDVKKPSYFADIQLEGPYKLWNHQHFLEATENGTNITDVVSYQIPFGLLGRLAHPILVKPKLNSIFNYRSQKIKELFNS